jgi:hypothetical protein
MLSSDKPTAGTAFSLQWQIMAAVHPAAATACGSAETCNEHSEVLSGAQDLAPHTGVILCQSGLPFVGKAGRYAPEGSNCHQPHADAKGNENRNDSPMNEYWNP